MASFVGPRTWADGWYVLPAKFLRKIEEGNPPRSHDRHFAQRNAQLPYGRKEVVENALCRIGNG